MDRIASFREEAFDLYSEIDLPFLLDKIAGKIKHHLHCQEASIFLYHPEKEELVFEIATGAKQEDLKRITLGMGEGIVGWIAEHNRPLIVNDCARDPRFAGRVDRRTKFHTDSILGVPVRIGDQLLGVLEAINKIGGQFGDQDQQLLEVIASFVAIPLQNAMLFRKVTLETREKGQLIQLSKKISSSLILSDIFAGIKEIITELVNAVEINIFVQADKKLYRLMSGDEILLNIKSVQDTTLIDQYTRFPLRTSQHTQGFLEVKAVARIPEEAIQLIRGLASFIAIAIEKFELYQQMIEKERMGRELQIARNIQQSFLISEKINFPGLDIAFLNLPSSQVGGDYYDIIPLSDRKVICSLNDICGHGIPASLLMAIFRTNFVYRVKKDRDIHKTVVHLNDLIAETTDASLYVTSFTCQIERKGLMLSYINAGHPAPLIMRQGKFFKLASQSVVLGLFAATDFPLAEFKLSRNDLIVMYTDGVIEAENRQGDQYSLERLMAFLQARAEQTPDQLKDGLIDDLKRFCGQENFQDDITFIIIRVL